MQVKFTLSAKVSVSRVLIDFDQSTFQVSGIIQYCHPETGRVINTKSFATDSQDIEDLSPLIDLINKEKVWDAISGGKDFMFNDFKTDIDDDIPF